MWGARDFGFILQRRLGPRLRGDSELGVGEVYQKLKIKAQKLVRVYRVTVEVGRVVKYR